MKGILMALNGIDIASYQAGLDFSKVPCDFAIIKATQGTGYTNPDCVRAVEQAMSLGKGVGVYHYISGGNAVAEANFFIDSILNWIGKVMICLDWEFDQNSAWGNESYLEQVINQVIARTGVPPMIYAPASRYNEVAPVAQRNNCGLWIAQYADMNPTGYQNTPWNEGAYTCAIRQYSGSGRLNGWNGDLDLDKFYGSLDDFRKYYGSSSSTPSKPSTSGPSGTTLQLATWTMEGKYGNGADRKKNLGSRYDEVQNFINHIASADVNTLVNEVYAGMYGDGLTRQTVLGSRYDEVQGAINANSAQYYTVQSGDNLGKIAIQFGTTVDQLVAWNNIANPDLIYAGQTIRVK
jgi:GH25 family lysozyme M1 (1,4-beta-N-acetylmuramidase)